MDYTVHGILQVRIIEWVDFPYSRGSYQSRDQAQASHIEGGFFTSWATREAKECLSGWLILSPPKLPCPEIELMSTALQAESFPSELFRKSWDGPKVEVRGPCFPKVVLVYILISVDVLPPCRKNWGCIEFKKDPKTLRVKREKH